MIGKYYSRVDELVPMRLLSAFVTSSVFVDDFVTVVLMVYSNFISPAPVEQFKG